MVGAQDSIPIVGKCVKARCTRHSKGLQVGEIRQMHPSSGRKDNRKSRIYNLLFVIFLLGLNC